MADYARLNEERQPILEALGFRNIAVHSYQKIQKPILQSIVAEHLADFENFLAELSL